MAQRGQAQEVVLRSSLSQAREGGSRAAAAGLWAITDAPRAALLCSTLARLVNAYMVCSMMWCKVRSEVLSPATHVGGLGDEGVRGVGTHFRNIV